jgi:hypothetical protein
MTRRTLRSTVEWDVLAIALFVGKLLLLVAVLYFSVWLVTRETVLTANYTVRLMVMAVVALLVIPALQLLLEDYDVLGVGLGILLPFLLLMALMRYLVIPEVSLRNEWVEAVAVTLILLGVILIMNLALDRLGYEPLVTSLLR